MQGTKYLYLAIDHFDWKIREHRDIMLNRLDINTTPEIEVLENWRNVFRSVRDRQPGLGIFEGIRIDVSELDPSKVALCSRRRSPEKGVTQFLFMLSADTQISLIYSDLMM